MVRSNAFRLFIAAAIGAGMALMFSWTEPLSPHAHAAAAEQGAYKVRTMQLPLIEAQIEKQLNEMSRQGWELHTAIGDKLIFKPQSR